MSLLAFLHHEASALILTDTLATTRDGESLMFQSKAWAIPHMNMALAVTGIADLGASWNDFVRTSLIARDIDMVDRFTPKQLRHIWSDLLAGSSLEREPAATIYHFGFPEGSDQLVRYVYRSTKDFESEHWDEPGFGIKPEPKGAFDVPDDLEGWVALAERVRAEQYARSADERIYIGGELYLLALQNWQSQIVRLHRFDDYDKAWLDMNARLRCEGAA